MNAPIVGTSDRLRSVFTQEFIKEAKALYPSWESLHEAIKCNHPIVGRYLYDAAYAESFDVDKVIASDSLEKLQSAATIAKRKRELYECYVSGKCIKTEKERRRHIGCPRLYGQTNEDDDVLDAFNYVYCSNNGCLSVIPMCPLFKSDVCWEKFDELGLKMK